MSTSIQKKEEIIKLMSLFHSKCDHLKALVPYELPKFHENDAPFFDNDDDDDDETTIEIDLEKEASTGTRGSVLFGTVHGFPAAFKALKEENMSRADYIDKLATEASFQYIFHAISMLFDFAMVTTVPAILGFTRLFSDELLRAGNVHQDIVIVMQLAVGDTVHHLDIDRSLYNLSLEDRLKLYGKLMLLLVAVCKFNLAHNDIHEKNVMIDVDTATVNLLDFGFAEAGTLQPKSDIFMYFFERERRLGTTESFRYKELEALQNKLMSTTSFTAEDSIFDQLCQLCGMAFVHETVQIPGREMTLRIYAKQLNGLEVTEGWTTFSVDEGISLSNERGQATRFFSYADGEGSFCASEYRKSKKSFLNMIEQIKAGTNADHCTRFITAQYCAADCPYTYARWLTNSAYLEIIKVRYGSATNQTDHYEFVKEDIKSAFTYVNYALTPVGRAKLYYFLAYTYRGSNLTLCRRFANEAHRNIIGSKAFARSLKRLKWLVQEHVIFATPSNTPTFQTEENSSVEEDGDSEVDADVEVVTSSFIHLGLEVPID